MDTFEICGEVIYVPQIARGLCLESLSIAKEMFGDMTNAELHKLRETEFSQFWQIAFELVEKKAPNFKFNPFDITSYPLEQVQNGQLLKPITDNLDRTLDMMLSLLDSDLENHDRIGPSLIILVVKNIYAVESEYLKKGDLDYTTFMAAVDFYILQLKNVCMFVSKLPTDLELVKTRFSRKSGAKKGGAAKSNLLADLKDFVTSEAASKYSDQTATLAAKRISNHLSNINGPLTESARTLKDQEHRFTAWIRESRKQIH